MKTKEASEMILEFAAGEETGSLYLAGRAKDIFPFSSSVCRADIFWRRPLLWERELWRSFRADLPSRRESTGPPMLGEGGTLFFWEEAIPYWIRVESEEEGEIRALQKNDLAVCESVCYRPDCRTVSFLLPAALLERR